MRSFLHILLLQVSVVLAVALLWLAQNYIVNGSGIHPIVATATACWLIALPYTSWFIVRDALDHYIHDDESLQCSDSQSTGE